MKQINFLKKTLLLVAMLAGSSMAWAYDSPYAATNAASPITVPNKIGLDYGTYYDWNTGYEPYSGNNTQYMKKGAYITFNLTVSAGQKQPLAFVMEASNGNNDGDYNADVTVKIYSSGKEATPEASETFTVPDNNNWDDYHLYYFTTSALTPGSYTLKISFSDQANVRNIGIFDNTLSVDNGFYSGTIKVTNSEANSIKNGASATYYFYNSTAGDYGLEMNFYRYTANTVGGSIGITITDVASNKDDYSGSFDYGSDYPTGYCTYGSGKITTVIPTLKTGLKKMTLSLTSTSDQYLCNYKNIGLKAMSAYDTSVGDITLEKGLYYNCRWNDSNNGKVSYIASDSKIHYYFYSVAEGTFDLNMNVNSTSSSGTWTATVYNFGTASITDTKNCTHSHTTGTETISGISIKRGLNRLSLSFAPSGSYLLDYNSLTLALNNVTAVTLDDNNNYNFTPYNSKAANVTLTRTITAGNWSTICLPFAMTSAQLKEAFGNDVKVAALTSGTESTLNFTSLDLTNEATTTTANQPYAIKVASNFTSETIEGVTIVEATPTQTIDNWQFVGTYSLVENLASGNYYFKENYLCQATGSQKIMPFRAYFHYTGTEAAAREITFSIDEETTDLSEELRVKSEEFATAIYDLQGRKVAKPTKGLYIVNGKKVVIK